MLVRVILLFILIHFDLYASLIPLDKFNEPTTSVNQKLQVGFDHFQNKIKSSKTVTLSNTPIVDYILALTQHTNNKNVAAALDYLLKTGGPWGISKTPATPAQAYALITAAQSVKKNHPEVANSNQSNNTAHYQAVVHIQRQKINEETKLLIDAVTSQEIPFFTKESNADPQTTFWNDFWLFGFLMGAAPDIEGRYLSDIWNFDNEKLESQHDYIQWIFPITTVGMGHKEKTPRITSHTRKLLKSHQNLLDAIKNNMHQSLNRMANFWGHALIEESDKVQKLVPIKGAEQWQENWIEKTHNYLRMSRILECLSLFGLSEERDALWNYLDDVARKDPRVRKSHQNFWKNAVIKHITLNDRW